LVTTIVQLFWNMIDKESHNRHYTEIVNNYH
jgi:hypothetical protein